MLAVMTAHKPDRSEQFRRMHGLWVLERCGALDDATLAAAAKDDSLGVRVHAQRVLSEREKWNADERAQALAGLKDSSADVRRAATDALGQHPSPDNIRPLLDLRYSVAPEDTHLLYVVRMALRNQLNNAAAWDAGPLKDWTERDARTIADVAPGIHTPEAAAFLLKHVQQYQEPREVVVGAVRHIARYGAPETAKSLLAFARGHHPEDLGLQAYMDSKGGSKRRRPGSGATSRDDDARGWAGRAAGKLLASKQAAEVKAERRAGGPVQAGESGG